MYRFLPDGSYETSKLSRVERLKHVISFGIGSLGRAHSKLDAMDSQLAPNEEMLEPEIFLNEFLSLSNDYLGYFEYADEQRWMNEYLSTLPSGSYTLPLERYRKRRPYQFIEALEDDLIKTLSETREENSGDLGPRLLELIELADKKQVIVSKSWPPKQYTKKIVDSLRSEFKSIFDEILPRVLEVYNEDICEQYQYRHNAFKNAEYFFEPPPHPRAMFPNTTAPV